MLLFSVYFPSVVKHFNISSTLFRELSFFKVQDNKIVKMQQIKKS
jgi:hypothetical protein